jgi:hypothetical protein
MISQPSSHSGAASGTDRPNNNLLRRLNSGDFALIAAHLTQEEEGPTRFCITRR